MKRLIFSLVMAMSVLGAAAAPVTVQVTPSNVTVVGDMALAADDCVKLSVKVGGQQQVCNGAQGGAIVQYMKFFLKVLSGGIGITIVLMLVVAGIQYITSIGDPANIRKAKERIINAITALILFVLAYAILSFLIPGGIF